MTPINIFIYVVILVGELYTIGAIILLPAHVGRANVTECHHTGDDECLRDYFATHDNELTRDHQKKLLTVMNINIAFGVLRIISSIACSVYLTLQKHKAKKIFTNMMKLNPVVLAGVTEIISYSFFMINLCDMYNVHPAYPIRMFLVTYYALVIYFQVFHIRSMLNYFEWNFPLFYVYKMTRGFAVVYYLGVQFWSQSLGFPDVSTRVVVAMGFLSTVFGYVNAEYTKWNKHRVRNRDRDKYERLEGHDMMQYSAV
jgi:hypothetical protein